MIFTNKQGVAREVLVGRNGCEDYLLMPAVPEKNLCAARITLNEDFWREIGKTLGYRFVKRERNKEELK